MLSARKPHGASGVLLVPVLPGTVLRSVEAATEHEPAAARVLPVASAVAGTLALIAAAIVLLDRGSGSKHAVSVPAPTVSKHAPDVVSHPTTVPPRSPVSARERARAAALRLADRLPVTLESTALLRVGSTLYVLGGTTRAGSPTDGIWQVDLRTGRVSAAGHFVEPLTGAGAASRGGVLYLAGGWTGKKSATGVLRWSPGRSSELVTRLPEALRTATAVFVGGRLYVAGGSPRRVFEVDVDAGTVTERASAPTQLSRQGANLDYLIESSRAAS